MPRLLKNDSVRLIESSVECLALAQIGICVFRKDEVKIPAARYSAEIGLIGSAIELAMNSVLVQAYGRKIIFKDDRYKTASEILHDFRALLRQSSGVITFLVNGVGDGQKHISKLIDLTNRFQVVITARANGLHNGIGLSYAVISSLFQEVSSFLSSLSESLNYHAYLPKIPRLVGIKIDKDLLIDELYTKLREQKDPNEQKTLISSIFLILPEVPKELPEWIEKFERFNIAPKKQDYLYLVNALKEATPVSLKKVTSSEKAISVRIDNNDPNAIPIAAHYLRTEFTQFKDQWYADISTANGRLNSKQIDLPPRLSIYKAFCHGIDESNLLSADEKFTAHQTWPFVASAFSVQSTGTNAPVWFLIRRTNDYPQLRALLKQAAKLGNPSFKANIDTITDAIEKMEKSKALDGKNTYYKKMQEDRIKFASTLGRLQKAYGPKNANFLGDKYSDMMPLFFDGELSLGDLVAEILADEAIKPDKKKYWVSQIMQVTPEVDDLPLLYDLLSRQDYSPSHTFLRKNMRALDFFIYGPKVEI